MNKLKIIILTLAVISFSVSVNYVSAQDATGSGKTPDAVGSGKTDPTKTTTDTTSLKKLENPLKVNSIQGVIYLAVDLAIYVGVIFAILAIIFIGFKFVMAQGKPDEIKEAKMWFFYVIIGLAVLISSKVIVEIVKTTFVNSGLVDKNLFEQQK